ncbi:hypothetical protein D9M68_916900 [compost metagenome]
MTNHAFVTQVREQTIDHHHTGCRWLDAASAVQVSSIGQGVAMEGKIRQFGHNEKSQCVALSGGQAGGEPNWPSAGNLRMLEGYSRA